MTGGAGFIGSYLVDGLLTRGHEVTIIDEKPPAETRAAWRQANITSLPQLLDATRGADAIYHLAAISNVNHAFADPMGCIDANLKGMACVLDAARQNKVGRVLFASSVWVYQAVRDQHPSESSPFAADGAPHLYTATKIAGEILCNTYRQLYGLPVTILRYGIPYGPMMRHDLLLPIFIRKAMAGEPLTVMGDGKQFRKFIYIEDLVAGNIAALAPQGANQTYNLEGSERVSVIEIAQTIARLVPGTKIEFLPPRPGDFGGVEVDGRKALAELGWKPVVKFTDGLARTIDYFKPIFSHPANDNGKGPAKAAATR